MTVAMFDAAGVSPESDEWYSPSWLFHALGVEFDVDPCSPGTPPSSVPAKRHLTKVENGLTAEWSGSVWLNPPFSSKRPWYEQLVETAGRQIAALQRELEAVEREFTSGEGLRRLDVHELRELIESEDPVKVVRTLVERVVLEPTLDCQIRCRQAPYNGLWRSVASPGGSEAQPQGVLLRVAPRWWALAG